MKLYEIDQALRNLNEAIEDGEIICETEEEWASVNETLNKLNLDRKAKLEQIALLISEEEAGAEELTKRAKALTERAKAKARRVEWYTNYIIHSMKAFNDKKIEGQHALLKITERDKVIIDDESKLERVYFREKITYEPDKKAIAEAIKNNEQVIGAHVEKNASLQIK